ncbi:hypothetical protein GCM10011348_19350 [Marinobacterium nitratireducens]|uniref:Exonuclease domain-containing protein n=1 Tax=Marinobacterium nitratireducens TaxID=518897 RepID=A0A917ZFF4_9GAMM|nr:hypothetical protein [Marinobacterium nitratireducens]GGO81094.1 hypothetical protein GCM10011348_19350 [Marinobacterium nitratireducens]
MDLICLDFEASGLGPRSYPIEVAWQDAASGEHDSFLVSPQGVPGWDDWSESAENIHGISRAQLEAEGVGAQQACRRLNRALEGRCVYCDALEFDVFWLRRLYEAAGMRPLFRLQGLESLLAGERLQRFLDRIASQQRRHRALDDVGDLIEALEYAFAVPE